MMPTVRFPRPIEPARLLLRVARAWVWLSCGAIVGGVAGVGAGFALPAWFESQSVLAVVPVDDPSTPGQTNAVDNAGAELPMLAAVLHSRSVADETVSRLGLAAAWGVRSTDEARLRLWQHLSITVDRKAALITLRMEDRRPERARAILATLTQVANDTEAALWTSRIHEHRGRLQERLSEVSRALAAAEQAMEQFKLKNGIVSLEDQVKATVDQAATLDKIRLEKQLGLHFAAGFGAADSPDVQQARRELSGAKRALQSLGDQRLGSSLPLADLPAIEAEHARLKRDLDVNAAAYDLLRRQIDQLATVESRPAGRAEILDPPSEPRRPYRPQRSVLAVEGAFTGLTLALLLVLGLMWRRALAS